MIAMEQPDCQTASADTDKQAVRKPRAKWQDVRKIR